MKYERDIKKWTLEFAIKVVKQTAMLKSMGVEWSLRDQFLRSGTSIGANVKEAKASSSRRELIRYYEISLKSANETEFWTEVIKKGYELEERVFEELNKDLMEIANVIARIIINLKK